MARFTQAQSDAALVAIRQRGMADRQCPMCHNRTWIVQTDGLVYLDLKPAPIPFPGYRGLNEPNLPCLAMVCTSCGNTQLLNVFVLGLGEAFGLTPIG
jgi:hypothetical protein